MKFFQSSPGFHSWLALQNVPEKLPDDHDSTHRNCCKECSLYHFAPPVYLSALPSMFCFSKGTLVTTVILWCCAPGVLPITITGPRSALSNSVVTFTWAHNSTDPTIFEINIDEALNSFLQTDPYFNLQNISTASGSTTFTLPPLAVGTHHIAFSSNDGFQILTEGSIEILAPSSSSIHGSSAAGSSTNVPISSPPVSSTGPSASSASSITATSSSSQSPSSRSQSSSTQLQTTTTGTQSGATKHRSNGGAIAGGIVGGTVVILLALLGWWYLRRRSRSTAAGELHGDISARPHFLAAPVSTALNGAPAVHNGSNNEFRPWEDNETNAVPFAVTPAPATAGITNRKQPIIMSWNPPAVGTPQSNPGPSRQQLLEEVQMLREHVDTMPPPSYPGE
ncbi:hypothetical protein B0H19DRAFT_658534 [Mycena capillaripes]|nr:hypothetical protein B0H19DRAFT_658534 [Mycena capillaripes]